MTPGVTQDDSSGTALLETRRETGRCCLLLLCGRSSAGPDLPEIERVAGEGARHLRLNSVLESLPPGAKKPRILGSHLFTTSYSSRVRSSCCVDALRNTGSSWAIWTMRGIVSDRSDRVLCKVSCE